MKKLNYKRITLTVLWIIAIAGLAGSLAFVSKSEKNIVANNLNIIIHNNDENPFISESDVKNFLNERNEMILSQRYRNLSIPEIEKALNSHKAIENAEVSADINGEIKMEILQRTPVLRIINKDGESYYIDSQSKLMPLNENYSARVLVVSGELHEPYATRYEYSVEQIKRNKAFKELSLLDDVLDVATEINADTLLSAMIHQVYVNKDKEMELFPVVGGHKIIFGNAKDITEKLNKLKLFYKEGLTKSDSWTKYTTINLKYKNLVVCTKK
ncbi:MAG: hypothetical protein PSX36_15250 [bacterium]|nr:hypothetical protein [bacterium]